MGEGSITILPVDTETWEFNAEVAIEWLTILNKIFQLWENWDDAWAKGELKQHKNEIRTMLAYYGFYPHLEHLSVESFSRKMENLRKWIKNQKEETRGLFDFLNEDFLKWFVSKIGQLFRQEALQDRLASTLDPFERIVSEIWSRGYMRVIWVLVTAITWYNAPKIKGLLHSEGKLGPRWKLKLSNVGEISEEEINEIVWIVNGYLREIMPNSKFELDDMLTVASYIKEAVGETWFSKADDVTKMEILKKALWRYIDDQSKVA